MQSFDIKKYLPHIYIAIGFLVLAALFCYPTLQGKELQQHDVVSNMAMSHEAKEYHKQTGEPTFWTNSMFGGMPTYTFFISGDHNGISYIISALYILGRPTFFFFLALIGFYILMNVLKVNRWLGVVGAIAFTFSSYNAVILAAGHETKMLDIGCMPAVLAGLLLIYRRQWLTGSAVLGISLALMGAASHFQIIYYMVIIVVFAVTGQLFIAIKEKKLKDFFLSSLIALGTAALAVGPNMQSILTTMEYSKESTRGGTSELASAHDAKKDNGGLDKDYAFRWSNSIGETFCLIVPYLYGGSSNEPLEKAPKSAELLAGNPSVGSLPMYWGPQPFLSGPVYFGAIVCFLFVLSLMVVRNPNKWWIVAICVLAIVMSWGYHFEALNYWLFDHLPGFNKFRVPSMILVIPQFLFPVMGVWAIHEILTKQQDSAKLWKSIKVAAGITAGICLVLAFGGSAFFDFSNPVAEKQYPAELVKTLKEDRADLAMKSALKSAVYILLAAALLWAFIKDKIKNTWMIAGLGLLIAVDLIGISHDYLNENNYAEPTDYEAQFQPRPVDQAIMKDPDPYYRVLDLTKDVYNDAMQAYFHKCIGGYNAAKLEIYQDLIDRQMSQATGRFNMQVLNMLNTKYIIFPGNNNQPGLQQNPEAAGNAWFVNEVKWANTAEEEMSSLDANLLGDTVKVPNAFDPKKTAIIRATHKDLLNGYTFGKDSVAYVKLAKYGLNNISFTSSNSQDGLAVFSDIYYPHGWKAYVDGQETPIIRTNYVLRAIKIPKGSHKIEFAFKPKSFYTGGTVAMISSILLYGLMLAALYVGLRNKKEDSGKAVK